jgi:outer membrane receptor protein involved in Fe transport
VKTTVEAQQEQEPATASTPQSPSSIAPSSSSEIVRLDEVTVTSQRRDEDQENVPMSLRAFSSQELEDRDAKRTSDVFQATPNVSFSSVQGSLQGTNLFIRGVGSVIPSIDQSIGVTNRLVFTTDSIRRLATRNVLAVLAARLNSRRDHWRE